MLYSFGHFPRLSGELPALFLSGYHWNPATRAPKEESGDRFLLRMSHRSELSASSDERQAIELLRGAKRLLLTGHLHPDGDCVGAEAALAEVLKSLGKEVWIVNPDPIDSEFDYLADEVTFGVYRGGELPRHDVSVLLDCSELSRCGELAPAITSHRSSRLTNVTRRR